METLLPALKSLAAGVSIGGGVHVLMRSRVAQRTWIRRAMREQAARLNAVAVAHKSRHFLRSEVVGHLHDELLREPSGPLVLTGPEGAGTSSVAQAGLARSTPSLLLHVNLREHAARQRTLFWQLVRAAGYY